MYLIVVPWTSYAEVATGKLLNVSFCKRPPHMIALGVKCPDLSMMAQECDAATLEFLRIGYHKMSSSCNILCSCQACEHGQRFCFCRCKLLRAARSLLLVACMLVKILTEKGLSISLSKKVERQRFSTLTFVTRCPSETLPDRRARVPNMTPLLSFFLCCC